jgi:hypothetical protein
MVMVGLIRQYGFEVKYCITLPATTKNQRNGESFT